MSSKRRRYALFASLVAGLITGTVLTGALKAQTTPPAYVVAEVAIQDADGFARDYASKVAGTLEPYGGRIITFGKLTALEGNTPQRFVLISFDSVGKARASYNSPVYQEIVPVRLKTAKSILFIAEGHQ